MTTSSRLAWLASAALLLAACGSSKTAPPPCDVAAQTGCGSGQACEPVAGAAAACFDPVVIAGHVSDIASGNKLADARVVALDANGAPATSMSTSLGDPDLGVFKLRLASTRDATGKPVGSSVTLRADRAGYASFPSGLRVALPVSTAAATHVGAEWVVSSALTEVGLMALPAPVPAGAILGTVAAPPAGVGVLVVAENQATHAALTAVPGPDGHFTIFNAPDGGYDVRAYAKGVNYTAVPPTGSPDLAHAVAAAATVDTVTPKPNPSVALVLATGMSAASVSGSINIVAAGSITGPTSVILAVASTFDPATARGTAPPGFRVGDVSNTWTLTGIPDGTYRVLAAFETDQYVRDPSDIGGTAVLEFTVANGVPTPATLGTFKVTAAVQLLSPLPAADGSCTQISQSPLPLPLPAGGCVAKTSPTIAWMKYSSTAFYRVTVVDAFGAVVWEADVVPPNGSEFVSYGEVSSKVTSTLTPAAALQPGMTYQARVRAWKTVSETISASEDLLGVFTWLP
jgi:hypothetical protein